MAISSLAKVRPTIVDLDIASFNPTQVLEALQQRCDIGLSLRITLGVSHEHADAPHPLGRPRPRRERRCSRRAAEPYDEVAPSQSLTSSARSRIGEGTNACPDGPHIMTPRT